MTSFEALKVLITAARKDPEAKAADILREILRETPYEEMPEVIEVSGPRFSFDEDMKIHVRMRRQKIRKSLVDLFEELLRRE